LTLYLDTSIFVPLTVFEQKTHAVQTWFSEQNPADLFFSEWGTTEFSAAIALKLRTGQIDSEVRAGANVLFSRYIQQYFQVLLVKRSDFRGREIRCIWPLPNRRRRRCAHWTRLCMPQR